MKEFFIFIVIIAVLVFAFQEFAPYFVQAYQNPVLFKSINSGENWQELFKVASLDILSLSVSPENPEHIYLGTQNRGVYKSYSGGRFWNRINQGDLSDRAEIQDILIDKNNPDKVYLLVFQDQQGRLIKSEDGGKTWQQIYVNPEKRSKIYSIAIDNYDPAIIYLSISGGGLLKSSDYGEHWQLLEYFDEKIIQIAVNSQDNRIIYAAAENGKIYQSFNQGESWRLLSDLSNQFSQLEKVIQLKLNSQQPNEIYLAGQYGLFYSWDSGKTWQKMDLVMPSKASKISSLEISGDNLFYGASSVVYNSKDKGRTWQLSDFNGERQISVIHVNFQNPQIVYVGIKD